jgi:hypothetical protein
MPVPITPALVRQLAFAVSTDVMNRGSAIAIDRKDMPLLDILWGKRKTDAGQAGSKTRVSLKTAGDEQFQGWNRLDVLGFEENEIDLFMEFEFYNIHQGLQFVHTDLLDMGYTIVYNNDRTKDFAKKAGADNLNRLCDLFKEKIETHQDNNKVLLDRMLHYSTDPLLPPGLDQLISVTPTVGTIGGKDRAANPLLQNVGGTLQGFDLNTLSCASGGDLYRGLTLARRQANLYGRGHGSKVTRLLCGSKFLDGYTCWRRLNGFTVNANASKLGKMDIAINDGDLSFGGMQLEWDPTLDDLAQNGTPDGGVPFDCRCYGLSEKTVQIRCPAGMDMQVSFPDDPPNQRFTRMSTDHRMAAVVTVPNANFVVAVDPATVTV